MQEMSSDGQCNTVEEENVCDVVRTRPRNVLARRGEGGGWSTMRDKEK